LGQRGKKVWSDDLRQVGTSYNITVDELLLWANALASINLSMGLEADIKARQTNAVDELDVIDLNFGFLRP
jgi:hypothetical protein